MRINLHLARASVLAPVRCSRWCGGCAQTSAAMHKELRPLCCILGEPALEPPRLALLPTLATWPVFDFPNPQGALSTGRHHLGGG